MNSPLPPIDGIPREALLGWVRSVAPDLQIRHSLEDGQPARAASFTLNGTLHAVGAIGESADDEIARGCARIIRAALGHTTDDVDHAERRRLEQEVVAAALQGNAAMADALALQLVTRNRGLRPNPRSNIR